MIETSKSGKVITEIFQKNSKEKTVEKIEKSKR
jgi:hypothetical protein